MQPQRQPPRADVRFQRVSERVTVALAPVVGVRALANATIVVGERRTAVVDTTFTPEQAAAVRVEAERLGGRPVDVVVLTHADPDHVLGLASYGAPMVVGSAAAAAVLRDPDVVRAYAAIAERQGVARFAMPRVDVAFDAHARVDLGGVVLEAAYVGPAHSVGDTVWWCAEERVAWSGDLVFHGSFPLVRTGVRRWLEGLDRLEGWRPQVVVPGHGEVAGPEVLAAQRRVLEALRAAVAPLHAAGVAAAEAAERSHDAPYRDLPLADERWAGAVAGIYRELEAGSKET
jgi:cyclase